MQDEKVFKYFRHIYQGRRLILLSVLRWSARNEQQVVEELVLIPVVRNERHALWKRVY
jgi:hypothetical protein